MKIKNYYRILGLESSATSDEIRMAYKRLVRKYHPDLHPDDKKVQRVFGEIKEAYEALGNPKSRQEYIESHFTATNDPRKVVHAFWENSLKLQ